MKRICSEEQLHLRHGEDITLELANGTERQRWMFQDGLNRWWEAIMHFYGPPSNPDKDVLLKWNIKSKSNEHLRGEFLDHYVPRILDLGFTIPDEGLKFNEETGHWEPGEIDWTIFWEIVKGNGPMTHVRLSKRRQVYDHHRWVREAMTENLWSAA